jgi:large subunit ribosomal protein L37e
MAKGTASMGKKSGKRGKIDRCRRCGKKTYHLSKKTCSSCGYGKTKKIRNYNWSKKPGKAKQKK